MKTKLLKNGFLTLFSFIFVLPVFSQDFNRVIELKNPRMNGQDVLALQKRLLEFTFYELGEADGYYGPMTEGVIKKIQASWDLPVTGIVNKEFWDIIFDEWRSSYWLPQKSIYYRNNLERSRNLGIGIYGSGDYIDEIFVYYTLEDKKIKVIDSTDGKLMFDINMSCYFINENDYRVEFSLSGQSYFIEETGFETEKGNIYYVINGVLYRDINDTRVRQNDKRIINNIINRINAIKSEFSARY